jgi:hypothetical protein
LELRAVREVIPRACLDLGDELIDLLGWREAADIEWIRGAAPFGKNRYCREWCYTGGGKYDYV